MGRVFFNTRENVHATDVAYTVLESDSGKVFMLTSTAGAYEVTMPTTVANLKGWNCTFKVAEHTPTGVITINFGSAIADGWSDDSTADIGVGTNDTQIMKILVTVAAYKGDFINVICDGTTWYFEAHSQVHDGFTTATS